MLKDFPKWASTMPREDSRKEMPQTSDSIDQGRGVGDTRGVHRSGRLKFGLNPEPTRLYQVEGRRTRC